MKGIRFGFVAASALAVATWVVVWTQPAAAQASTQLAVKLDDYRIFHDVTMVPAGEVAFDVVNVGDDVHEMIVIKSELDTAALPPSSIKGEVDEAAIGEYVGGFEDVQPAQAMTGTLVLGPGRYILLCNLTDHYSKGMVSTLEVQ